jgi:hypothetical protein
MYISAQQLVQIHAMRFALLLPLATFKEKVWGSNISPTHDANSHHVIFGEK